MKSFEACRKADIKAAGGDAEFTHARQKSLETHMKRLEVGGVPLADPAQRMRVSC